MRALAFLFLLAGCASNESNDNCACTLSVTEGDLGVVQKLTLGCGEQGCLAGRSYGCDNDNVVMLGLCDVDLATPPVLDDMGKPVCFPVHATCSAGLPCCGSGDAGVTATCDPVSAQCCVATGSPCTTSGDCCPGKSCVPIGGNNVCGS